MTYRGLVGLRGDEPHRGISLRVRDAGLTERAKFIIFKSRQGLCRASNGRKVMGQRTGLGCDRRALGGLLLTALAYSGSLSAQADSAATGIDPAAEASAAGASVIVATPVAEGVDAPGDASQGMPEHELSRTVGNLTLYPILNIGGGYRSDVYNENGDNGGSAFVNARAGGGVQGENRGHLYGGEYFAEEMWYLDSDVNNDDELIQRAVAYWGTAFDVRNNIDLGVEYLDSYDTRGQDDPVRGIRDTTDEEDPDTWTQLSYGGNYAYGAADARGRLELGACATCLEYDNNDQQYRDRDVIDLGATLSMQLSGRTRGFVQVVHSDFDYRNDTPDDPAGGRNLDSDEWRYMVGASWLASGRFTGVGRVGQVRKDFNDPLRGSSGDYEEMSWDVVANWAPTGRNLVSLSYFQAPREPLVWEEDELVDNFVEVEQISLDGSHQLTANTMLTAGGYMGWDKWKPSGRNDDLWGASAGLRFGLARWGSVGISYFHRERDSSNRANDYSDDGVLIDFNIGSLFGFGDSRAPAICLLRSFTPGTGYNGFAGY